MVDFFRTWRERKEQRKMREMWTFQSTGAKAEIMSRVEPLVTKTYPELSENDRAKFLKLTCQFMTPEPPGSEIEEIVRNSPESWSAQAAHLAEESITTADHDLLAAMAHAEYSWAMLLLWGSYNPDEPLSPNSDLLRQSLKCIDTLLTYGPEIARYCSTGVQVCGMLRDYEAGYRYATLAIEADPQNPEAWRMAGLASIGVDRYAEAEERLVRARSMWPAILGVDEPLALARSRK